MADAFSHQADWDAIAEEYPYKDKSMARSKFQLAMSTIKNVNIPQKSPRKRKAAGNGDGNVTTPAKKRGGKVGGDDKDSGMTPAKKAVGKKAKAAEETEEEDAKVKMEEDAAVKTEDPASDAAVKEESSNEGSEVAI